MTPGLDTSQIRTAELAVITRLGWRLHRPTTRTYIELMAGLVGRRFISPDVVRIANDIADEMLNGALPCNEAPCLWPA